jgi:hypothetical protein
MEFKNGLAARSLLLALLPGLLTAAPAPSAEIVPAVFDLAAATITYERDEGHCPGGSKYAITLRGEGTGTFTGRREATLLGPVSFSVPPDSVLALLNTLSHCGFFEADSTLATPQTFSRWIDGSIRSDLGEEHCSHDWARITVKIGSFSKAVEGGAQGPCSIGVRGAGIDALVRSHQWLLGTKAEAWPVVAWCSDSVRVCLVTKSGDMSRLPLSLGRGGYGALGRGTSGPDPSPNGRWIAFTRFGDLWLFDVLDQRETQLTSFNRASADSIGCLTYDGW